MKKAMGEDDNKDFKNENEQKKAFDKNYAKAFKDATGYNEYKLGHDLFNALQKDDVAVNIKNYPTLRHIIDEQYIETRSDF